VNIPAYTQFLAAVIWLAVSPLAAGPLAAAELDAPSTLGSPETYPHTTAPSVVEQPYFDLDAHLDQPSGLLIGSDQWRWQLLPRDLIYKSYLAGAKESRMGSQFFRGHNEDWFWGATLGARVGLLRFGDSDPVFPQGIQVDAEGSAQVRLDISHEVDVQATDYRGGIPVTFGYGRHQTKLAYYHMSSHLGDEFLLRFPDYPRLNWSRDAFVLGHSIYLTDRWRVYAEVGWAFHADITEPWEFQFGTEWAPTSPTGFRGAPFFAVNGHLRQEVEYGGNLTAELGWSWMSDRDRRLLRIGFYYYNGKSNQNSFYNDFDQHVGGGVWYDF
jgi:hypothetical protein